MGAKIYLADATAVQLTRDADGLAKALAYLSARGAPLPGGQYLSHLFVVGAEAGQTRLQDEQHREMARVRQEIREGSWSDRLQSLGKAYSVSRQQAEVRQSVSGQSGETQLGLAHALLPPIHERLKRLYRLGAQQGSHPAGAYPAAENGRKWSVFTALAAVLVGLLVIALLIMVYAPLLPCQPCSAWRPAWPLPCWARRCCIPCCGCWPVADEERVARVGQTLIFCIKERKELNVLLGILIIFGLLLVAGVLLYNSLVT